MLCRRWCYHTTVMPDWAVNMINYSLAALCSYAFWAVSVTSALHNLVSQADAAAVNWELKSELWIMKCLKEFIENHDYVTLVGASKAGRIYIDVQLTKNLLLCPM